MSTVGPNRRGTRETDSIEWILKWFVHGFLFPGVACAVEKTEHLEAAETRVKKAFYRGCLTLLTDALDEALSLEIKDDVLAALKRLCAQSPVHEGSSNRLFLTARTFEKEHILGIDKEGILGPVFDVRSLDLSLLSFAYMGVDRVLNKTDIVKVLEPGAASPWGDEAVNAEQLLERLVEDHLLVSAGVGKLVFIHATVMEYLGVRALAELESSIARMHEEPRLELIGIADVPDFKKGAEVNSIVVSPDKQYLLSDFRYGSMELYDISTGKTIREYKGHIYWVNCVAFSPDGTAIISGSGDNALKIWNTKTAECIKTFTLPWKPKEIHPLPGHQGIYATFNRNRTITFFDLRKYI